MTTPIPCASDTPQAEPFGFSLPSFQTASADWVPQDEKDRHRALPSGAALACECVRKLNMHEQGDKLYPCAFILVLSATWLEKGYDAQIREGITRFVAPLFGSLPVVVSCFGEEFPASEFCFEGVALICLAFPRRQPMGALANRPWALP